MLHFDPILTLWCLAIVQFIALASACLARMSEGSLREARYQRLCLGCLALAGLATLASLLVGPSTCVLSGAALAVTVLTATWDIGATVL